MKWLTIIVLLLTFLCACGNGEEDPVVVTQVKQTPAQEIEQASNEDPKDESADVAAENFEPSYVEMPRPGVISRYDKIVRKYARRYLLDWRLVSAQIYAESRFRIAARSYCGALGLMQIMPGTAEWLEGKAKQDAPELGEASRTLLDPKTNIHLGCYYDAMLFSRIKDAADNSERRKMMLAAYNAGPGNLNRARKKSDMPETWDGIRSYLPAETRNYIPTVYDRYEVYKRWAVLKPY